MDFQFTASCYKREWKLNLPTFKIYKLYFFTNNFNIFLKVATKLLGLNV